MVRLILCLFLLARTSLFNFLPPDKVPIKLVVIADDEDIKNRITSKMLNQLHSFLVLKVVDDDNAILVITVNEAIIKCNNNIAGISMTTILTRKITTNDNRAAKEILGTVFNIITKDGIEQKCADITAKFDVDYFEHLK